MTTKGTVAERRRTRSRLKQQRRRARDVDEQKDLEQQLYVLQHFLTQYNKPTTIKALPWKQVAGALQDAVDDTMTINIKLRQQVEHLTSLGHCLASWMAAIDRRCNVPEASEPFTWQHVWLPTDPMARCTSLDWFTQRLYHNTDRMLACTSFPSSHFPVMDHVEIDHGNDLLDRIARIQVDVALSFEDTYAAMRASIWSALRGDTAPVATTYLDQEMLESIDASMYYQRMQTPDKECDYNVGREFRSQNRIVFLVGNVRPAADTDATHLGWRSRLAWYTLERLEPQATRVRVLLYNAPCLDANGEHMTWHEEFCQIDSSFCHVPQADRWTTHQRFMDAYTAKYLTRHWQELGLHLLPTVSN